MNPQGARSARIQSQGCGTRVDQKARRLLVEGRVTVLEVGHDKPGRAVVEGDHGTYEIVFNGRVECPCPAWTQKCSHARAVELVVEAKA